MSLLKYILKENSIITNLFKQEIQYYSDELNMSCSDINSGECMYVAENVYDKLESKGINAEVLSDALFHDQSGDEDPDLLYDPNEYSDKVPKNFYEKGLPSHYWIYYNGKHYDAEVPNGVRDMFDIPIFKNHFK